MANLFPLFILVLVPSFGGCAVNLPAVKEAVKEAVQQSIKEPVKEAVQESVKEPVKEAIKELGKDTPRVLRAAPAPAPPAPPPPSIKTAPVEPALLPKDAGL